MTEDIYKQLCETMAARGGMYPGMDIPEFYELSKSLFTPEEAAVNNALPRGLNTAGAIAETIGKKEEEVTPVLEEMAGKGLLFTLMKGNRTLYAGLPFVPGIFEYQFMRGTHTEKDRKLARLIHAYKVIVDQHRKPRTDAFPVFRVIPVNQTIETKTQVHTYDQVKSYIENSEP